jgi:hypothetical protein
MKKKKRSKLVVVNVKMSVADRMSLKASAKRHAKGNLSAWVRHAGRKYTPKKGEKISLKAA